MNSIELLSDIVIYSKYARYLPALNRRETWAEIVTRNATMHAKKYPHIANEIYEVFAKYVLPKKVFPSMRGLQFGGRAIEVSPSRIYNCSAVAIDSIDAFSETMFLLLGGSGVGISVQKHHIAKLPDLEGPKIRRRRYLVSDDISGWGSAIKALMESYFDHKMGIEFDYSDIRPKGSTLVTAGGLAPGPQPLKDCIHNIRKVLDKAIDERGSGCRLKPIEAHDISCHIADAVMAGGIRRAALISVFSHDDTEMLSAKTGNWWELHPERGRSNNSVVLIRYKMTKDGFFNIWEYIKNSGAGEPGFYLSNDKNYQPNPCCEISMRNNGFCNLTEINVSNIESQKDLNNRAKAAAFIGTLQAGYSDFHFLREKWRKNVEEEALLGVSMTGIASGEILKYDIAKTASLVNKENKRVAKLININRAKRLTAIKPSGTTSLVAGCSSGIHAYHAPYYERRMRLNKDEPIYLYLKNILPSELLEDDWMDPTNTAVLVMPIKSPENSIYRDESELSLLQRVKKFQLEWINPGHRSGSNKNNVSVTVSIKDENWDKVGDWMWDNREIYTGISVLPHSNSTYRQMPFTDITEDKYNYLIDILTGIDIDLSEIVEKTDLTDLNGESACSGNGCEISNI